MIYYISTRTYVMYIEIFDLFLHKVVHRGITIPVKAQSYIPSRAFSTPKNEEFRSVRCDSLGVRRMNVIHLSCASTSAHIFCMFKNVSVFRRVNVDARKNVRPVPVYVRYAQVESML